MQQIHFKIDLKRSNRKLSNNVVYRKTGMSVLNTYKGQHNSES